MENQKYFCGHCEQVLCRASYYSHRRRYYNHLTKQWSKTKLPYHSVINTVSADREPVFSPDDESGFSGINIDLEKEFNFSEDEADCIHLRM